LSAESYWQNVDEIEPLNFYSFYLYFFRKPGLKYDRVSGTIKNTIDDLEKGSAVQNPLKKLKQLGSLPPVEPGQVLAGNVEDFPSLKRLPRSITGSF
jgi:hypothetical protein